MTYEQRRARYDRMLAAYEAGTTLKAIGAAEDPPLTKERVRAILAKPPKVVGRPLGSFKEAPPAD